MKTHSKKLRTKGKSKLRKGLGRLSTLFQSKDHEGAKRLAMELSSQYPDNPTSWKVLGVLHHQSGETARALEFTKRATELDPLDPETFCNLGSVYKDLGNFEEAEKQLIKALEMRHGFAEAFFNLGNLYKVQGKLNDALEAYTQAIKFKPNMSMAYNNFANTLQRLGNYESALQSYRKAVQLDKRNVEAHSNLGSLLREMKQLDEAEKCCKRALELRPDFADAHNNLGGIYLENGKTQEAISSYKSALENKADFPEAYHMLASLTGNTTLAAPKEYVEGLFDKFASKFDQSLVQDLGYRTPKKIAEMILSQNQANNIGTVLDLGCGTGLFGAEIAGYCTIIEGVDISRRMLEEALKKKVYHKLVQAEIVEFLSNFEINFNYIVSADVFVYLGDLSPVFELVKNRSKIPGKLVFSTEHIEGTEFKLQETGRYAHSKSYILSLCEKFDFSVSQFEVAPLRKEKGAFIEGGIYVLDF